MAGRKWKWHQEVMETEVKGIMRVDVSVKPAEIGGDANWYATISGITGDALAPARGDIDYYCAGACSRRVARRAAAARAIRTEHSPATPNNPNSAESESRSEPSSRPCRPIRRRTPD